MADEGRPGELLEPVARSRRRAPAASVVRETPASYFARVVVELVTREDLAGTERLAGSTLADDGHLELAGASQVGLGEEQVVVGEGDLERPLQLRWLVRSMDDGHADARAQSGRLDRSGAGPAAAPANASRRRAAPVGSARCSARERTSKGTMGISRARARRLKRTLSMPSAEAATPDPVYARPTDSHSAWTVPSSPNGP